MASNNPFKAPALVYSLAALPLIFPIQNVEPDDIVKAYHHEQSYYATADNNDDVFVPGWQSYDYLNITPETWQIGTFEIIEANGDKVEANRPKTWYSENNVNAIGDKAQRHSSQCQEYLAPVIAKRLYHNKPVPDHEWPAIQYSVTRPARHLQWHRSQ